MALVVDDDRLFLQQCVTLLEEEGFECLSADSGAAGLSLLEAENIDLVLCDVLMPDVDGHAVVAKARTVTSRPGIVWITALGEGQALDQLRAEGLPVLLKPLDPAEAGRTIAWVMHERYLAQRGLEQRELLALYRMATAATSDVALPQMLDRMLATCVGALGGETGSILLAGGLGQQKVLTMTASFRLERREPKPIRFGEHVAGWVAAHRRPLRLVGRVDAYPQFRGLPSNPVVAESLLAPLVFRGEVLGVINVTSSLPGKLGQEKLALLVSAADIAAAAVQRDRMERAREHQDRLAMLGQLSASMAHELNNPLACLKSSLHTLSALLLDGGSPLSEAPVLREEVQAIVHEADESVERMVSLVGNLKGVSRKSSSSQAQQNVDVDALLRRAEALVHPQLKHRVALKVEPGGTPPVLADQNRILQVLVNLVVNAAQAVERQGQVIIRSRAEARHVIVEVEDNGPGIPDEVADHLFEPFFTTKPEGEGTGLGLSISRQIARDHGGDLTFSTKVGTGTCFRLSLPLGRSAPTRLPRLLVVDDEPALVLALVRTLQHDFEVVPAASAHQALEVAQGKALDLILTDFSMPGLTGVELIRALRQRGHTAPAVIVTAMQDDERVLAAYRDALVSRVVTKPWNTNSLAAELLEVIRPEES